jgi:hypothetical protein
MKVYLIKTPEYESEHFKDVCELLSSFDGALEFVASEYEFDKEQFQFLQKFYPDFKFKYESDIKKINFNKELGIPISWRELFSLCDFYRNTFYNLKIKRKLTWQQGNQQPQRQRLRKKQPL